MKIVEAQARANQIAFHERRPRRFGKSQTLRQISRALAVCDKITISGCFAADPVTIGVVTMELGARGPPSPCALAMSLRGIPSASGVVPDHLSRIQSYPLPSRDARSIAINDPSLAKTRHPDLERLKLHDSASFGFKRRKKPDMTTERALRDNTDSMGMLSATQLERKREKGRDLQGLIWQRTKEHTDNLEYILSELHRSQEADKRVVLAMRQRNRELEEENAHLRMVLSEAGLAIDLRPHRKFENALLGIDLSNEAYQ